MLTNPDPDLMRIFDFTPADLEANRAGKLSEQQLQSLNDYVRREQLILKRIIIGLPMLVAIVCILTFPLTEIRINLLKGGMLYIFTLIATFIVAGYFYLGTSDRKQDIRTQKVAVATGKASLYSITFQTKMGIRIKYKNAAGFVYRYSVTVPPMDFVLSYRVGAQFEDYYFNKGEDTVYRCFYLPNSRKLLSLEAVNQS